jgi:hypothetical protein
MKLPIITALALTLGLAPPALAARAFHTIPQPAGTYYDGSAGWGVSPSGEILGSFFTQPGGNEADAEGFIDLHKVVTILNYPGAYFTVWHGKNKAGTLIGEAGIFGIAGVIESASGTFSSYSYPGADYTRFTGINSKGVISGNYYDGSYHGLIYNSGATTVFNFPGAQDTACTSINDSGVIAGNYTTSGVTHAYYLKGTTAKSFDVKGATYTDARGINDSGEIVGFWQDSTGAFHGFLREKTGKITTIDYPKSTGTKVFGINDSDEISGEWLNAAGQWMPFYAVEKSQ